MDYRPIPGQETMNNVPSSDLPMDDMTMMARERASNLLMPYANMASSTGGSELQTSATNPPGNPVPGSPGAGIEDKLYQAVHPDTFNKILETIMQFVTGKPIPRQGGGPVYPGEDYIVGENGPEKLRTNVPGQIYPNPMAPGLKYAGPSAAETMGQFMPEPYTPEYSAWETSFPGSPQSRGANLPVPITPGVKVKRPPPGYPAEREHAGYGVPETGGELQDYGEGIKWRWSEPETEATRRGDVEARQRILTEAGRATERYGMPIPEKGYYDVHPEERAMDIARADNRELMDMFKTAKDPRNKAAIGELIRANMATPEAYYKAGMEFGPTSPGSQEKLAHAEYLRGAPTAHMEAIREQNKAHLEGIQKQVAGHLEAAKIMSEVKDPLMKEIGALITQGQKNAEMTGVAFNPQEMISQALSVYRAIGAIDDEQWSKLPKEYKPPVQGAKLAPDGNWYILDPKRKGKYLRVE